MLKANISINLSKIKDNPSYIAKSKKGEYEAYQSGASRFRERMGDKSKLKGYEVTGVPRSEELYWC